MTENYLRIEFHNVCHRNHVCTTLFRWGHCYCLGAKASRHFYPIEFEHNRRSKMTAAKKTPVAACPTMHGMWKKTIWTTESPLSYTSDPESHITTLLNHPRLRHPFSVFPLVVSLSQTLATHVFVFLSVLCGS